MNTGFSRRYEFLSWRMAKLLLLLLLPSAVGAAAPGAAGAAAPRTRFIEAARISTRGNAGFEHFNLDGRDYVAVANFFTSAPGRRISSQSCRSRGGVPSKRAGPLGGMLLFV